jgi:hypothetical protein
MGNQQTIIYVISDSTGDTAKKLMESAAGQFKQQDFIINRFPHIQSRKKLTDIIKQAKSDNAVIAFTFVKKAMRTLTRELAAENELEYLDLMSKPLTIIANRLKQEPSEEIALKYKLDQAYFKRIEAMEFTLKFDDLNEKRGIEEADIVLVGISRTSKTPLSIYLSYLGYKTANVPLVPEVEVHPAVMANQDNKVIGLTIDPLLLNDIRIERLKKMGLGDDATYAADSRIKQELNYADSLMAEMGCPIIDVTDKTIEETAVEVLAYFNK